MNLRDAYKGRHVVRGGRHSPETQWLHPSPVPDNIQEEKSSFFQFKNNWLRTDGPTDRPTDNPCYRDGWTHLKKILRN